MEEKKHYKFRIEKYGLDLVNEKGLYESDIAFLEAILDEMVARGGPGPDGKIQFTMDELAALTLKSGYDLSGKRLN